MKTIIELDGALVWSPGALMDFAESRLKTYT